MNFPDRATQFTSNYLDIIENRLNIKWEDDGQPSFLTSEINIFSLERARNELFDLLRDPSRDNAISDCRAYGKEHIQTVGFGLVQDFDKFVKTGFLCGERLVLWDFLASRGLAEIDDSENSKIAIGSIASNLLLLKPIIKKGGVVLLPHPKDWSDKAIYNLNELARNSKISTTNYGLVSTLSILEEIPMHPYTLFPDNSINWPGYPKGLFESEYFSKEHYAFHKVINNLFEDQRFNFLSDVNASHFYDIVNQETSFYEELHKMLTPHNSQKSPPEINKFSESAISRLSELLDKRNRRIASNVSNTLGGSLAVIAAIGTLLNATTLLPTVTAVGAGTAILGLSASLSRFLSNYFKNQNENVVVQAFYEISQAPFYRESNESQ